MHVKQQAENSEETESEYKFYNFKDRDFTFKFVKRLWANESSYAKEEDMSDISEEEEEKRLTQSHAVEKSQRTDSNHSRQNRIPNHLVLSDDNENT